MAKLAVVDAALDGSLLDIQEATALLTPEELDCFRERLACLTDDVTQARGHVAAIRAGLEQSTAVTR